MLPTTELRKCPCGADFEPRRSGRPQKWCGKKCPAKLEHLAGRTNAWYHENRAYARARESFRRHRHKLTGELRLSELRRKGMNQGVYAAMLAAQHGACAICGTTKPSPRRDYFDIDHNHETGQIRGLLCEVCNRAIGLMQDSPKRLRTAAEYLERNARSLPLWVVPKPKPRRKYQR